MSIVQVINELLGSFLESIIILLSFIFLNNKRDFILKNKLKAAIFFVLYTIFSYWATTYLPPGLHSISLIVFTIVALSFITISNIYASTISMAIIIIFMMIVEVGVLFIETIVLRLDLNTIMNTLHIKIIHNIVCSVVKLIMIALLYRIKFNIFKIAIFKKESSHLSFAIFQISMMSIFIISVNFVVSHKTDIMLYNMLLFAIYILFIVVAFLDYKEREKILLIQHKFEAQKEYVKNMEAVMNVIRREKHDFANHLNTLLALCVLKKPDGLERVGNYVRKLTNSMNTSYRVFHTGNDYIDGLLAVKSNYAFERDIHLEVDIDAPLNMADIDDNNLTSVIANIVDNAFEAVLTQPDQESKIVSICTYIEDEKYYLSIADNGPMILQEVEERIFDNGFSTKSKNKLDHGYGLFIVKRLVEQHNGQIKVLSSEEETEFLIKLNVRKGSNGENRSEDDKRDTA